MLWTAPALLEIMKHILLASVAMKELARWWPTSRKGQHTKAQ